MAAGDEEAFKRLKHCLGLESVRWFEPARLAGGCGHKVLADNLASLLNRSVDSGAQQDDEAVVVSRKVNPGNGGHVVALCAHVAATKPSPRSSMTGLP